MPGGKWVKNVKATTKLAPAARGVLKLRLQVVQEQLHLAVKEPFKDPEPIHQLRVATRRARAAIDIFSSCFSRRIAKKVNKHLRTIRDAAGAARDWDVFLAGLTQWRNQQKSRHYPGIDFVRGYAWDQRVAAQSHLETTVQKYRKSFAKLQARTLADIHKPCASRPRNLGELAGLILAKLVRKMSKNGAGNIDNIQLLHRLRITGKQLRYAMEVFAPCFATPFRGRLYPQVTAMQDILGAIHDCYVAYDVLESVRTKVRKTIPGDWPRYKLSIEGILRNHHEKILREKQRFRKCWERWHRSGAKTLLNAIGK